MKYTVYSKDNCTYCVQAKNLLSLKEIPFEEVKIGEGVSREDFFQLFTERDLPLPRTVPQIFKEDNNGVQYIGGFDSLREEIG